MFESLLTAHSVTFILVTSYDKLPPPANTRSDIFHALAFKTSLSPVQLIIHWAKYHPTVDKILGLISAVQHKALGSRVLSFTEMWVLLQQGRENGCDRKGEIMFTSLFRHGVYLWARATVGKYANDHACLSGIN